MLRKKLTAIALTIMLVFSATSVFSPNAFAEQNPSISKQRPQHDEIKAKLQVKVDAVQQKRIADLKIAMQAKKSGEVSREYASKQVSLADKIMMQYQMPDKAEQEKQMLVKIMTENFKKTLAKQKHIQKLVESGNVQLHEKKTIEYGRTK